MDVLTLVNHSLPSETLVVSNVIESNDLAVSQVFLVFEGLCRGTKE